MLLFNLITSACMTITLVAGEGATLPLSLSQEEILIYEQLLDHYTGKLVVLPDLICDNPTELESTWKFVTDSNAPWWGPIPRTPLLQDAFKNLVSRSKSRWRIQPWSSKYKLQNGELPIENPPITVFRFSPIGFNTSKTIAVLIRSGLQGPIAGSTEFIILRKTDGRWVVDSERMIGIS